MLWSPFEAIKYYYIPSHFIRLSINDAGKKTETSFFITFVQFLSEVVYWTPHIAFQLISYKVKFSWQWEVKRSRDYKKVWRIVQIALIRKLTGIIAIKIDVVWFDWMIFMFCSLERLKIVLIADSNYIPIGVGVNYFMQRRQWSTISWICIAIRFRQNHGSSSSNGFHVAVSATPDRLNVR